MARQESDEDIEAGLKALADEIQTRRIRSIALPPLGSGLGGLKWHDVRPRIEGALGGLDDVRISIFEPHAATPGTIARGGGVDILHPKVSPLPLGGGLLAALPERERRGSRARCILLTNGPDEIVADRLSGLIAPHGVVEPGRHHWMPRGIAGPAEARLGEEPAFLSDEHRKVVTNWWLAVREHANTPNWDIASTATIDGKLGFMLVEAKAHAAEIKTDGKAAGGRFENPHGSMRHAGKRAPH